MGILLFSFVTSVQDGKKKDRSHVESPFMQTFTSRKNWPHLPGEKAFHALPSLIENPIMYIQTLHPTRRNLKCLNYRGASIAEVNPARARRKRFRPQRVYEPGARERAAPRPSLAPMWANIRDNGRRSWRARAYIPARNNRPSPE